MAETSVGGILIPDWVKTRFADSVTKGLVVEIGPCAWEAWRQPWCEVGDTVVFGRYTGIVLTGIDGTEYRLLNDADILTRIHPDVEIGEADKLGLLGNQHGVQA